MAKNGVPLDIAFDMDDTSRTAFAIIMSEQEGNEFDWSIMKFKETQ